MSHTHPASYPRCCVSSAGGRSALRRIFRIFLVEREKMSSSTLLRLTTSILGTVIHRYPRKPFDILSQVRCPVARMKSNGEIDKKGVSYSTLDTKANALTQERSCVGWPNSIASDPSSFRQGPCLLLLVFI
jgi:hypothetical protein